MFCASTTLPFTLRTESPKAAVSPCVVNQTPLSRCLAAGDGKNSPARAWPPRYDGTHRRFCLAVAGFAVSPARLPGVLRFLKIRAVRSNAQGLGGGSAMDCGVSDDEFSLNPGAGRGGRQREEEEEEEDEAPALRAALHFSIGEICSAADGKLPMTGGAVSTLAEVRH